MVAKMSVVATTYWSFAYLPTAAFIVLTLLLMSSIVLVVRKFISPLRRSTGGRKFLRAAPFLIIGLTSVLIMMSSLTLLGPVSMIQNKSAPNVKYPEFLQKYELQDGIKAQAIDREHGLLLFKYSRQYVVLQYKTAPQGNVAGWSKDVPNQSLDQQLGNRGTAIVSALVNGFGWIFAIGLMMLFMWRRPPAQWKIFQPQISKSLRPMQRRDEYASGGELFALQYVEDPPALILENPGVREMRVSGQSAARLIQVLRTLDFSDSAVKTHGEWTVHVFGPTTEAIVHHPGSSQTIRLTEALYRKCAPSMHRFATDHGFTLAKEIQDSEITNEPESSLPDSVKAQVPIANGGQFRQALLPRR